MPQTLRIARSRARPAEYADALAEATARLRDRKKELDEATERHTKAQQEVLTILASAGIKSSTVGIGDVRFKVTSVQTETLTINEPGLRKALTAPVFDKLCNLKLDRTKLEIAIADGRVDPVVVASHTTKTLRKPFVKISLVQGVEPNADD